MKNHIKIIMDGLLKIVKNLKCKVSCCCKSTCVMGDVPPSPLPNIIKETNM